MFDRRCLLTTSCLTVLLLVPAKAHANPIGGTVAGGSAGISSAGNTLTVNQKSNRAVIDWQSFNIGQDETTTFKQPSSSSIAVNRVRGDANPSQILGALNANGNVVVINPNGVLFGPHSQVNVNSLIATTADIDQKNFLQTGRLNFNQPGNPNASVINQGTITAKQAGLVGLVAPNVENSGIITAKLGRVQLSSGDTATVDLYGDGLMEVAVSDKVKSQLVANTGTINAQGGTIALTAATGSQIVNSLVHVQGELSAPAISQQGGEIIIGEAPAAQNSEAGSLKSETRSLKSENQPDVVVSGRVNASGQQPGQTGGHIAIKGNNTSITTTATLDASGAAGGGTVETSGKTLGLQGSVKVSGGIGPNGNWLLDPTTLTVESGGGANLAASTVDPSAIVSALNGANITLTADDSMTIANAIDSSANASGGNLILDTPVLSLNALITLKAGSGLSGSATTVNVGASGLVQNGVDAAAAGATVNLAAATYNLSNEITIGKNLTLDGSTSGATILNGRNQTRVMEIDGTGGGITVNLNALTIENGNGVGTNENGYGGGLLIEATSGNHATVTINDSIVSNNSATGYGGGIYNNGRNSGGEASLTLDNSSILGNHAHSAGGGIFSDGYNYGDVSLIINSSAISGNSADQSGGGIYNEGFASGNATLTVNNSTIANNSTSSSSGAILNEGVSGNATALITNSTISGNSAVNAGGIYNSGSGGSSIVTIGATIIVGNTASGSESDFGNDSTLTSNVSSRPTASISLNASGRTMRP